VKIRQTTAPVPGLRALAPVIIGLVSAVAGMGGAWAVGATTRHERHYSMDIQPAVVARKNAVDPHAAPALRAPVTLVAFLNPIAGCGINSPFGLRKMPWEEGGRLHEGVDIAAPAGSLVRATLDGTVGRTGSSSSYGRFVEIIHADGLTSFYAHMERLNGLRSGQTVKSGQTVGYAGSTGRSTGSHLHFEIRLRGKPLNPALFIGQTFASAKALPLTAAAKVSGRVRLAQVSRWPAGVGASIASTPRASRQEVKIVQGLQYRRGGRMRMVLTPVADLNIPTRQAPTTATADASGYRPGDLPISRPTPKAAPPIRIKPINTTHTG
jgi:hypothetical protein